MAGQPKSSTRKRGASKRRTAATKRTRTRAKDKTVETTTLEAEGAKLLYAEEDGKLKEPRERSMIERFHVAQRIAIERALPKPTPWAKLAADVGMSERGAKKLHAQYIRDTVQMGDTTGTKILEEALFTFTASIDRLSYLVENAKQESVQVGATRQLLEAVRGRVELLAAMGRMPRSFRAVDELNLLAKVVRRIVEITEERKLDPEIVQEFIDLLSEMQPVIEGTATEVPLREISAA
jgi:hypothetical protein